MIHTLKKKKSSLNIRKNLLCLKKKKKKTCKLLYFKSPSKTSPVFFHFQVLLAYKKKINKIEVITFFEVDLILLCRWKIVILTLIQGSNIWFLIPFRKEISTGITQYASIQCKLFSLFFEEGYMKFSMKFKLVHLYYFFFELELVWSVLFNTNT